MSKIKFICKTEHYQLKDDRNSIILNPVIEPTNAYISWEDKTLTILFQMSVTNANGRKVFIKEGSGMKQFDSTNIETIVNFNGEEIEAGQALMWGWQYNRNDVISMGKPSFANVLKYVYLNDPDSISFIPGPGMQLAIDLIMETTMIQGEPLGDYFDLVEETNTQE